MHTGVSGVFVGYDQIITNDFELTSLELVQPQIYMMIYDDIGTNLE
jgi:hypothetical protein